MRSFENTSFLRYLRRVDILAVLEQRDFRLLTAAFTLSKLGDGLFLMAAVRLFGDFGWSQGVVTAFTVSWFLHLLIVPLAGVLADRLSRKSVMLFALLAQVSILAVLVVVGYVVGLGFWIMVVTVPAIASAREFFSPARSAMLPNLLARRRLVSGNAALVASENAIGLVQTAVGVSLGVVLGGLNAMGVAAVAYGLAALLIRRMEPTASAAGRPVRGPGSQPYARPIELVAIAVRDLADAAKFILKHPFLRALALVSALFTALVWESSIVKLYQLLWDTSLMGSGVYERFHYLWAVCLLLGLPAVPWLARRLGDIRVALIAFAVMGGVLGMLAGAMQQWQ